jgi:PPOX class probable F420-dependent enzyme
MATIPDSFRQLVATGPLATIITLNVDGTPHVSLAWAALEGDELVWSTFFDQRKIENLRRDPRITISFIARESGGETLHPYAVVRGRARITEGGALDLMDRLSPLFIGQDRFPNREMPPGFTVHVTIDRVYGMGPWREDARA